MYNFFQYPLFSTKDIFENEKVLNLAKDLITLEIEILGGDLSYLERFFSEIQKSALSQKVSENVFKVSFPLMGKELGKKIGQNIRTIDLIESYRIIFGTTKILNGKVLDIGCGNGLISNSLLDDDAELHLLDVVDYRDDSMRNVPFNKISQNDTLPFIDNFFDNAMLNVVLHHADDPIKLLKETARVCKGSIYITESLIGLSSGIETLNKTQLIDDDKLLSQWKTLKDCEKRFSELDNESQIQHAQFQDWLYNSVIQGDVPVPYNFQTDECWQEIFKKAGLKLIKKQWLGYDQRSAPEYHILYVCN